LGSTPPDAAVLGESVSRGISLIDQAAEVAGTGNQRHLASDKGTAGTLAITGGRLAPLLGIGLGLLGFGLLLVGRRRKRVI